MLYQTNSEFRRAVEEAAGRVYSHKEWVLVENFLYLNGVHPPCDDKDIKQGVSDMKYLRGVISE